MTNAKILSGMASGVLIMFFFGCWWLAIALPDMRHIPFWLEGIAIAVAATVMAGVGIIAGKVIRATRAGGASSLTERSEGRKISRRLRWIIVAEAAAICAASFFLSRLQLQRDILLGIALIVGLHFFPLARVFGASEYYFTAIAGSLLAIAALWVPVEPARHVFLGFSMGFVLWATGLAVLYRAIHFKGALRASAG